MLETLEPATEASLPLIIGETLRMRGRWERGAPRFVPPQNQRTGCRREDAVALIPNGVKLSAQA